MQKFAMVQYLKEQQEIKDYNREYRRQYYARKKHEVEDNSLKARRAEFSDSEQEEIPPVSCRNRAAISPTKVRTETFKEEKINERRGRGERFESTGLILLYCESCKNMYKKINYQVETECRRCKMTLKFRCVICERRYKSHGACIQHIKYKHPSAKPKF